MTQNIKKNNGIKIFFIVLGLLFIVFLGCKIVKKNIRPRVQIVDEDATSDLIYTFLERGIENEYMPYIDNIKINKIFYTKNKNVTDLLFCTSYQLLFTNSNHPTWELCLQVQNGQLISEYEARSYVSILTEAAFLYKLIDEKQPKKILSINKIEETVNQKLAKLKNEHQDTLEKKDETNKDSKLPNVPVV